MIFFRFIPMMVLMVWLGVGCIGAGPHLSFDNRGNLAGIPGLPEDFVKVNNDILLTGSGSNLSQSDNFTVFGATNFVSGVPSKGQRYQVTGSQVVLGRNNVIENIK